MEDVDLNLQVSPGSSALTLFWNNLAAVRYKVVCNNEINTTEQAYSHSISLSVHNATSKLLDKLIPGTSYNCCVSAEGLGENFISRDCVTSTVLDGGGGLATPLVGLVGGIIGVLIAVLAIGGIAVACVISNTHRLVHSQ